MHDFCQLAPVYASLTQPQTWCTAYELMEDWSTSAWKSETVLEFIFVPTHKMLFELSVSVELQAVLLIQCLTFLSVDVNTILVRWRLGTGFIFRCGCLDRRFPRFRFHMDYFPGETMEHCWCVSSSGQVCRFGWECFHSQAAKKNWTLCVGQTSLRLYCTSVTNVVKQFQ